MDASTVTLVAQQDSLGFLTPDEKRIISNFRSMDASGQQGISMVSQEYKRLFPLRMFRLIAGGAA